MPIQIDYYFVGASPFTYLGHQAIQKAAAKHGADLNYKPVNILGLWEKSVAVPPAQRPPVRQRYRLLELQRIAEMRNLPINLKPVYYPVDMSLADCCVIAVLQQGGDPANFMAAVFDGVWANDDNMADEGEVARRLNEAGFEPLSVIAQANSEAVKTIRENNTRKAIEQDAIGVPAYVLNGEVFWGQDRIEFLDHALSSGRPAFKSN